MPRGRKPGIKNDKKINISTITCLSCGGNKKIKDFYASSSVLNMGTGRVQYCKECCINNSCDSKGSVDIEKFKNVLEKIDKPFLQDVLQAAYEENNKAKDSGGKEIHILGLYFKNINSLPQYKNFTWKDSVLSNNSPENCDNETLVNNSSKLDVTEDVIDFFGHGYSNQEYESMFKKYNFLKNNYPEKTNMHIEALKTYVRYKVKEETAIANNDVGSASKWADLANKAATNAKINPNQLSKADLSDGLSTFSELSQAVEKEVDIIPILPRFKYRPNDALDFNIWCYVNYMRDLSGLPPCRYEDVYAFYDRRKKDYIEQYGDPYGIFTDDTTEKNRENILKFIKEGDS